MHYGIIGGIIGPRLAALALGGAVAACAVPAEETSFRAFAPLLAQGEQATVGESGVTRMEGGLSGPLYAETAEGPREEGLLLCRFALELDSEALTESGEADCELTRPGASDPITARFSCEGRLGEGCTGEFVITGGTGRYEGASGGGTATLKARQRTFGLGEDNAVRETVFALAHWDRLTIRLPG